MVLTPERVSDAQIVLEGILTKGMAMSSHGCWLLWRVR